MDYADKIARELSADGWTWGHKTTVRPDGLELHVVDAHCGDRLPSVRLPSVLDPRAPTR